MRKNIKFPAPQLSWLKEVNIDLDMTGRHYALLASCDGQIEEDVVLSILKDLIEEDANQLTIAELKYCFMMVKINSFENEYPIKVECQHIKPDGKICGCINTINALLSDSDLNPTPSDYKPPKILFRRDDKEKLWNVIPPTMNKVSALYNYFFVTKGITKDELIENKKLSFEFAFLYGLLCLVDDDKNFFVKETDTFDELLDTSLSEDNNKPKATILNVNLHSRIQELLKDVQEVDSYGVQTKIYDIKCKECGGRIIFQIPSLLHGLVS